MGNALKIEQSIEFTDCIECSVPIGMPLELYRSLSGGRLHGKTFYCVRGHAQIFAGQSREQKLQAEVERQKREVEAQMQRQEVLRTELKGEQLRRGKAEAKLKRTETRVHAGVCPHCDRTFSQLARHMKCKHPEAAA